METVAKERTRAQHHELSVRDGEADVALLLKNETQFLLADYAEEGDGGWKGSAWTPH